MPEGPRPGRVGRVAASLGRATRASAASHALKTSDALVTSNQNSTSRRKRRPWCRVATPRKCGTRPRVRVGRDGGGVWDATARSGAAPSF